MEGKKDTLGAVGVGSGREASKEENNLFGYEHGAS